MPLKKKLFWRKVYEKFTLDYLVEMAMLAATTVSIWLWREQLQKLLFTRIELIWPISAMLLLLLIAWLARRVLFFRYEKETLSLDKGLYEKICTSFLSQDTMMPVRSNQFSGGPFELSQVFAIVEILKHSSKSDFHFEHPRLEKKKKKLVAEIEVFDDLILTHTYSSRNHENSLFSVPTEWEYDQQERFEKAIEELDQHEKVLILAYDNFIGTGRKLLKV